MNVCLLDSSPRFRRDKRSQMTNVARFVSLRIVLERVPGGDIIKTLSALSQDLVDDARQAVDKGLDYLDRGVDKEGLWPCHYHYISQPDSRHVDVNPFVGALASLALRHVDDERAQAVVQRIKRYTLRAMEDYGVWRYWPHLPPDADTTSVCNLSVGFHPAFLNGWHQSQLLRHRGERGLFHTWLDNRQVNDADAIVNASVIACLGDNSGTKAAQAWLENIIRAGTEAEDIHYYWDTIDLYNTIARAHRNHASVFTDILPIVVGRIRERRRRDGSYGDVLRTALATSTYYQLGQSLSIAQRYETIRNLLDRQLADGSWPASPQASGPFWPDERALVFSSPSFDAACSIEALTYLLADELRLRA